MEPLNHSQYKMEWQFWIQWVIANALGLIGGLIVINFLPHLASLDIFFITGLVIGGTVGTTQWFILRLKIPVSCIWIPASIIGAGVGWFCALWVYATGITATYLSLVFLLYDEVFFAETTNKTAIVFEMAPVLSLSGATIGLFIGLNQWFVLRKQLQHAKWWIWINTISFGFAGLLSASSPYLNKGIIPFFYSKPVEKIQSISVFIALSFIGFLLILLLQSSIHKLKISLSLITIIIILGISIPVILTIIRLFQTS